ncbi:hypothetical protein HZA57_03210, partial [Candidatus Poribacteria bacterium]|nr:hypothetical protein [Candidatus Poribacteria bacterium]
MTFRHFASLAMLAAALVMTSARASAGGAFPLVTRYDDLGTTSTEVSAFWPLVRHWSGGETTVTALHPLFSHARYSKTGLRQTHLLWPLYAWSYRPESWTAGERHSVSIFPLWYSGRGVRNGAPFYTRYLFPLYWQGGDGEGDYFVLFPVVWYGKNVTPAVPLFPGRKQNFIALWPLAGDFRSYYARDRIQFVLWPLFLKAEKGTGDGHVSQYSVPWPILTWYTG